MTKLEATVMELICAVMGWAFLSLHAPILALCFFIPAAFFGYLTFRKPKNHD